MRSPTTNLPEKNRYYTFDKSWIDIVFLCGRVGHKIPTIENLGIAKVSAVVLPNSRGRFVSIVSLHVAARPISESAVNSVIPMRTRC